MKIQTKKRNLAFKLFLMLFALSGFNLLAQRAPAEFSVNAAGGVSTYCFAPSPKNSSSVGYSSDFGIGFTGFLSRQVGINVGVGFGLLNVKSKVANLKTIKTDLSDNLNGMHYDLYSTLSNYTEVHKSLFLNIPVMLLFQTQQKQYWGWKQSPRPGFYAMGGIKVLFLFNNKYESQIESLTNAAYYHELKNWAATQVFAGYGEFDKGYKHSAKMEFGVMAMFALELGVKWWLGNNMCFYTGVFFDCGLNDPNKDNRKPIKNYTSEEELEGLKDHKGLSMLKVSDRTNLIAIGIKLRFAFSKLQSRY